MHNKLIVFVILFCLNAQALQAQTITAGAATGTITGCVGTASASPNIQQIVVTASGLTSNLTALVPANFEIALAATGPYVTAVGLQLTGGSVFIRSAASAQIGSISGNVSFSSAGASTVNVQVTATIKALPTVDPVASQSVSNGSSTTPFNFTGNAQTYRWTNNNPGIGIAASGSGDIPSFTAVNTTGSAVTATFNVTPAPAGFIFTANFNGSSVSMINTGNNTVTATIPVGSGPFATLVNPNQQEVYVSCFNKNEVDVLDASTGNITAKIPTGNEPNGMAISSDGGLLYVINTNDFSISVINTTTHSVTATIPVGPLPQFLMVSPDNSRLYVATYGTSGSGATYVINTATNAVTAIIPTSLGPSGMVASPDGSHIYITDRINSDLDVINTSTNTVSAIIPVGQNPLQPVISADGSRIYTSNELSNNVSVVNTATNNVIATIPTGNYGAGCALSADGGSLYVVNRVSGSVSVISTASNTVINTILLNSTTLDNPVISPDGSRLYITDDVANVVHVINTATNTLITNVAAGTNPLITTRSVSTGNGCSGLPVTFTLTVNAAIPAITTSGSPNQVGSSYGIASGSSNFTVSGANLSSAITVTPPSGFEVSTDGVTFSNTVSVGGANAPGPFTVYIRLAAISNAGSYGGAIVLSSAGAASVNVNMPTSTIVPALLNVFGNVSRLYGTPLPAAIVYDSSTPGYVPPSYSLLNGNTFRSVTFNFNSGTEATDPAGTYTNAVTMSNFEGDNGFLASNYSITYATYDLYILPAPITITAQDVTKPYGATLTTDPASTKTMVSSMQNNETIGTVTMTYGAGASSTATAGAYPGSVVPSNATGGTFLPSNYTITYVPGTLTVEGAPPPAIVETGVPAALQTVYGTPSATTRIQVSGTYLVAGITITAPAGFEISNNNTSFSSTITLAPDATNTVTATTIYIRLAATAPVNTYSGNIVMTSTGANTVTVAMTGTVTPALLTITANPVTKVYGSLLAGGAGSTAFITTGLQNNEIIGSATVSYGSGALAGDAVGVYTGSVVASAATGGSFNVANYTITYIPAAVTVTPAALLITANDLSRAFATPNPQLTVSYSGFVNNDGPAQLTTLPFASTTAVLISQAGQYPITVSGANSPDYTISYEAGTLTVYAAPQNIQIPNTFTPNGDGINDRWDIKDLVFYPTCTVEVYSRYGQHLYHSNGYPEAWDGTYNSKSLPFGTYYYVINLNDGTATKLSGYVAIIR